MSPRRASAREAAILDEITKQVPKVKEGSLKREAFQQVIDEAKSSGVPKEKIRTVLEKQGVTVKEEQSQGLSPEQINLLSSRAHELNKGMEDDFFGSGGPPVALMINRNKLPPEIGTRFDAHGIAKGSVQQQLDTLNTLLTKGINPEKPFHTMQLSVAKEDQAGVPAMGAANVYDTGQFIVLGKPDKLIKDEGISAVLVNKPFYEAVEFLQNTFPTVKFIKANEMQDGLRGMI